MKEEPLKLGKIKAGILEKLGLLDEGDKTVYVLSKDLDTLSVNHPNNYLRILEGMKEILSHPDCVSLVNKEIRLCKLLNKGESLYVFELSLVKKERWVYRSIRSICRATIPHKAYMMHK